MNPDELAIRQLHTDVIAAFNQYDLEKLLALHTEDIVVMEPDRPALLGKNEVRPVFANAFNFLKSTNTVFHLGFQIHEVEVWGKRAFARGQVTKITENPDGTQKEEMGKYLCLFKRQGDGNWLRSHVVASNDAPSKKEEFWKE